MRPLSGRLFGPGRGYGTGLVTAARDWMMLTPGLDLGMFRV